MASGAAAALIAVAVLSDPKTSRAVLVATAGRTDKMLRVNTLDPAIQVSGRSLDR